MQNPTLDDYDFDKLSKLDSMGYNWEILENLVYLKHVSKEYGFKIVYNNQEKPHLWKRTKGNGVDLVLEVKTRDGVAFKLWIEESYMSHDYYYRRSWFEKCRVPRFRKVPQTRYDIPIILTNKPNNMFGIRPIAKKHGIRHIFNMDALLDFISRIRNLNFYHAIHPILSTVAKPSVVKSTTQNTNNVYAYGSEQEDKGFIEWIKWLHEPVRPIYLDYLRYKRDVEED